MKAEKGEEGVAADSMWPTSAEHLAIANQLAQIYRNLLALIKKYEANPQLPHHFLGAKRHIYLSILALIGIEMTEKLTSLSELGMDECPVCGGAVVVSLVEMKFFYGCEDVVELRAVVPSYACNACDESFTGPDADMIMEQAVARYKATKRL